jgi:hypothetical protein
LPKYISIEILSHCVLISFATQNPISLRRAISSFPPTRTDECDLCIKLPVVSRRQATFRLVKFDSPAESQGVFVIANYGKTNPTKLNDKAVGPVGREYGECRFWFSRGSVVYSFRPF